MTPCDAHLSQQENNISPNLQKNNYSKWGRGAANKNCTVKGQGLGIFFTTATRLWGLPSLLSNEYRGFFPCG